MKAAHPVRRPTDKHEPAGRGSPNVRNGATPKTVLSEVGPLPLPATRPRRAARQVHAPAGLIEDAVIPNWNQAVNAPDIAYVGRLPIGVA